MLTGLIVGFVIPVMICFAILMLVMGFRIKGDITLD